MRILLVEDEAPLRETLAARLSKVSTGSMLIAFVFNMSGPATWTAGHGYRRVVRGLTFPAHRPLVQIDHLLAGPGIRAGAAEVLPGVGSDHLPVRAQLTPGG